MPRLYRWIRTQRRILAIALLVTVSLVPVVALGAAGPKGVAGPSSTALFIHNLNPTAPLALEALFHRQSGGAAIPVSRSPIAAGGQATIYGPSEPGLAKDLHAGVLTGDQPFDVLIRTAGMSDRGRFSVMSEAPQTDTALVLPLVTRGWRGMYTYVTVQNADDTQATEVQLAFTAEGAAQPVQTRQISLAPGKATTLNVANDPRLTGLPEGFVGTVQLTAAVPIAAHAVVNVADSLNAAFDYNAVPLAAASDTVFAARARAGETQPEQPGSSFDSLLAVANPGSQPVQVTVTYTGLQGACAGLTVVHGGAAFAVPAGGMRLFDQGADGSSLSTSASGLGSSCGAQARVTADGPVAVVAAERTMRDGAVTAAVAYNAPSPAEADARWIIPVVRREHIGLSSEVTLVNPGPDDAVAQFTAQINNGPTVVVHDIALPAGRSQVIVPEHVADWPAGMYGSGWVDSSTPILVLMADMARDGRQDSAMAQALHGRPETGRRRVVVPLMANTTELPGQPPVPTFTPRPTDTPGPPTPSPMPTAANGAGPKAFAITGLRLQAMGDGAGTSTAVGLRPWSAADVVTVTTAVQPIASFYGPALSMERGGYSLDLRSSGPLAASARTTFFSRSDDLGGQETGRVDIEPPASGADVLVPAVFKGADSLNSLVTIQNADTSAPADITLSLVAATGGDPVAQTNLTLPPGSAQTFDIGRDQAFVDVPLGFIGSLRARSANLLAVQTVVDVESSAMAAAGFNGVPVGGLGATAVLPLVRSVVPGAGDAHSSRLWVANPEDTPVEVSLDYRGLSGTCAGTHSTHPGQPHIVPAHGVLAFDQGAAGASLPTGLSGLPAGCTATATVTAGGDNHVAAVLLDRRMAAADVLAAAAYNAFTTTQAGRHLALPFTAREYFDDTSDIVVFNPGPSVAHVVLSVELEGRDNAGPLACGAQCSVDIAAGDAHVFAPDAITAWPRSRYGHGMLTSDQPIMAVLDESQPNGSRDDLLSQGINVEAAMAAGTTRLTMPIFLNMALLRRPGPALGAPGWQSAWSIAAGLYLPLTLAPRSAGGSR